MVETAEAVEVTTAAVATTVLEKLRGYGVDSNFPAGEPNTQYDEIEPNFSPEASVEQVEAMRSGKGLSGVQRVANFLNRHEGHGRADTKFPRFSEEKAAELKGFLAEHGLEDAMQYDAESKRVTLDTSKFTPELREAFKENVVQTNRQIQSEAAIEVQSENISDKAGRFARWGEIIDRKVNALAERASNLVQGVKENVKNFGEDAKEFWEDGKQGFRNIGNDIKDTAQGAANKVGDFIRNNDARFGATLKEGEKDLPTMVADGANAVGNKIDGAVDYLASDKPREVVNQFGADLSKKVDAIGKSFNNGVNAVENAARSRADKIVNGVNRAVNSLDEAVNPTKHELKNKVAGLEDKLATVMGLLEKNGMKFDGIVTEAGSQVVGDMTRTSEVGVKK